jgi:hypothetical protein
MHFPATGHGLLLLGLIASTAHAQQCPNPPFQPVPNGEAYFETYVESVPVAKSIHETPPGAVPFDRLWVMEDHEPITFDTWVLDEATGGYTQETVVIENPVLVVTLIAINYQGVCLDGNFIWPGFRQLQQYTSRCDLYGGNLWFTVDGNMSEYLQNDLQIDPSCLNPGIDPVDAQAPCRKAISWTVPAVGMPYAFGDLVYPYINPGGNGAWWQQQVMVAVADRNSFVRPSYNPTVGPGTKTMPTDGGVPIWAGDTYRLAEDGDPTYAAQQAILEDFVGYIYTTSQDPNDCESTEGGCSGTKPYIGAEGFAEWLDQWQTNSWENDDPHFRFPFTSVGLTGDWQTWASKTGAPSETLPALSEFILKGDQDIYVLGNWPVAQYLGGRQEGQVDWCDSCSGDLNLDGRVDGTDLDILLSLWNTPNTCANLDKTDAYIGGGSLLRLLNKWGECPAWPLPEMRPYGCE